jgi:hypothetical protein
MKIEIKSVVKWALPIAGAIFLQSCFLYAVYGIYRTVQDINNVLTLVNSSLTRIQTVVNEGKDLKRAAKDGTLIASLAEKIPNLVQKEVNRAFNEKINGLSKDLKLSSLDFSRNAEAENLAGATKSFNDMANTFNRFGDLMTEMDQTATQGGS